ncbi:hypothetical protein B0H13DRAFT_2412782 [Mycena leptocephala]|nr:hypothetical protein B0H13DRAFT_2412782 [Mycena leptocephala]
MPITYARQHFIPTANIPSCFKHFALVLVGACVPGRIPSFCRFGTCPGKIFAEPQNCYQMYCPKALGNSMLSRSKLLKLLRWPGTQSQIIFSNANSSNWHHGLQHKKWSSVLIRITMFKTNGFNISELLIFGRSGDGYGPYAHMSVDTPESISALFDTAKDSDTLLETVRVFAPQIVRETHQRRTSSFLNRMGKTGMTYFYCWEYAAPLHEDHDDAWSIACQLWKNVKTDEYNFAYAQWGIIIQTQENCVWFFNPRHLHGTVLPHELSRPFVISRGIHTTIRSKEVEWAQEFETVRQTFEERSAYWQGNVE